MYQDAGAEDGEDDDVPELTAADGEEEDETGLDPDEIQTIMAQASCSRAKAVKALRKHTNIVDAILVCSSVYECFAICFDRVCGSMCSINSLSVCVWLVRVNTTAELCFFFFLSYAGIDLYIWLTSTYTHRN